MMKDNNNNNMQSNYAKSNGQKPRRDVHQQSTAMDLNNNNNNNNNTNNHGNYGQKSGKAPSGSSTSSSKLYLIASVMTLAIVIIGSFVPATNCQAVAAGGSKKQAPVGSSLATSGAKEKQQEKQQIAPLQAMESSIANAKVKLSSNDMAMAAGHHHGKSHGKYYMYAEVPKKHSYKMGFKRGNHKHTIERKESVHKSHVHSYFKWHDKKGKGEHKFEFKHDDHKKKKYHH